MQRGANRNGAMHARPCRPTEFDPMSVEVETVPTRSSTSPCTLPPEQGIVFLPGIGGPRCWNRFSSIRKHWSVATSHPPPPGLVTTVVTDLGLPTASSGTPTVVGDDCFITTSRGSPPVAASGLGSPRSFLKLVSKPLPPTTLARPPMRHLVRTLGHPPPSPPSIHHHSKHRVKKARNRLLVVVTAQNLLM
jgi:hypothetical protein